MTKSRKVKAEARQEILTLRNLMDATGKLFAAKNFAGENLRWFLINLLYGPVFHLQKVKNLLRLAKSIKRGRTGHAGVIL